MNLSTCSVLQCNENRAIKVNLGILKRLMSCKFSDLQCERAGARLSRDSHSLSVWGEGSIRGTGAGRHGDLQELFLLHWSGSRLHSTNVQTKRCVMS